MRTDDKHGSMRLLAGTLVGLGILLLALLLGLLNIQSHLQLWLQAHARWTRSQMVAIDALELYAVSGEPVHLERARDAITRMDSARRARVVASQDPIDPAAIREGLAGLGVSAADAASMTRMFQLFAGTRPMRAAMDDWSSSDDQVARFDAIATELADLRTANPTPTAGQVAGYTHELRDLRVHAERTSLDFSALLLDGMSGLRRVVNASALLLTLSFVWLFFYILRKAVARIRDSESWLRASFEQANIGMLQLEADGTVRHANDAAARILGVPLRETMGRPLQDFVVYGDRDRFVEGLREPGAAVDVAHDGDHYTMQGSDGSARTIRAAITKVDGGAPQRRGQRFAMIEDVTEAHAMRAELARQAHYDDLTGLLNRSEVLRQVGMGMREMQEGRLPHLSVCLVDMDHFRLINESAGLRMADHVLQVVAKRLQEGTGGVGSVGRLGGDQFVVMLPGMQSGDAVAFAARLSELLSQPDQGMPHGLMMPTCSMGVVAVDREHASASEVLASAAAACERAKQAGRNRVRLIVRDRDAGHGSMSRAEWANRLRAAIASGAFELDAQRIEACREGDPVLQAELLLRMRDADGTRIMPGQFMPAAETYGISMDIDRLVLLMAVQTIREYIARGGPPQVFYVNLSITSVAEPEFGLFVRHMLDGEPGLAAMLCFEVTESGVMANLDEAIAFMRMVQQRGSRVALDDFGTGQSSFAQLRMLPVDIVKVDGSFVRDIDHDPNSEVLIRSICEMSHALGKQVVVEWVERREDRLRMGALGADYMQGFGLHRPEPLSEYLAGIH